VVTHRDDHQPMHARIWEWMRLTRQVPRLRTACGGHGDGKHRTAVRRAVRPTSCAKLQQRARHAATAQDPLSVLQRHHLFRNSKLIVRCQRRSRDGPAHQAHLTLPSNSCVMPHSTVGFE
jgi:hypothetical protein